MIKKVQISPKLFNNTAKLINNDLRALLTITNIIHNNDLDSILNSINNTELGWLRKGERWDKQSNKYNKIAKQIYMLSTKLGYIKKVISPKNSLYDKAIILGGTVSKVRLRLTSMLEEWDNGCRWNHIIVLGSDRTLEGDISDRLLLPSLINTKYPKTEIGMIQYVLYTEYYKKFSNELRQIPIMVINTSKNIINNKIRVDTDDTIETWIKEDILSDINKVLLFSNQPYNRYQEKVIKLILQSKCLNHINVKTVGAAASKTLHPVIILDSIARDLNLLRKMSSFIP